MGLRLQFFALGILPLRYLEIAKIDYFVLTNQNFQLTRFHVWNSISIRFIFFSFDSEKSFKLKIGIKIVHDWNWCIPLLLLVYELQDFENFLLNSIFSRMNSWEFINTDLYLCHALQTSSIGEKSNAEDLLYSEKNRRNRRLKMKDTSLDVSLVSSWNIQTTIGKDLQ